MKGLPLRKLGANAVALAFDMTGDAKVDVTLHVGRAGGAYDVIADVEAAAGVTIPDIEAIEFKRQNQQQADDTSANTKTILIAAARLPAGTVITEKDSLEIENATYEIKTADRDPTRALWILEVRR